MVIKRYSFMLLLFGLTSCGIYRQNVINAPLMQQKGQAQLGGHKSFSGLEGHAAYALTDKVALQASYGDLGEDLEDISPVNYIINKHNFKEIGVGVYDKRESGWIREVFFLTGKGMTSRYLVGGNAAGLLDTSFKKVDYLRYTLQADFGMVNNNFEFAITPRLAGVHYYKVFDDRRRDHNDLSKFHIYGEGAFTIRYHVFKFLILSSQASITVPLKYTRESDYFEFAPFNASFGLIINLNFFNSPNQKVERVNP